MGNWKSKAVFSVDGFFAPENKGDKIVGKIVEFIPSTGADSSGFFVIELREDCKRVKDADGDVSVAKKGSKVGVNRYTGLKGLENREDKDVANAWEKGLSIVFTEEVKVAKGKAKNFEVTID